jgi:hypothetical protein
MKFRDATMQSPRLRTSTIALIVLAGCFGVGREAGAAPTVKCYKTEALSKTLPTATAQGWGTVNLTYSYSVYLRGPETQEATAVQEYKKFVFRPESFGIDGVTTATVSTNPEGDALIVQNKFTIEKRSGTSWSLGAGFPPSISVAVGPGTENTKTRSVKTAEPTKTRAETFVSRNNSSLRNSFVLRNTNFSLKSFTMKPSVKLGARNNEIWAPGDTVNIGQSDGKYSSVYNWINDKNPRPSYAGLSIANCSSVNWGNV